MMGAPTPRPPAAFSTEPLGLGVTLVALARGIPIFEKSEPSRVVVGGVGGSGGGVGSSGGCAPRHTPLSGFGVGAGDGKPGQLSNLLCAAERTPTCH